MRMNNSRLRSLWCVTNGLAVAPPAIMFIMGVSTCAHAHAHAHAHARAHGRPVGRAAHVSSHSAPPRECAWSHLQEAEVVEETAHAVDDLGARFGS